MIRPNNRTSSGHQLLPGRSPAAPSLFAWLLLIAVLLVGNSAGYAQISIPLPGSSPRPAATQASPQQEQQARRYLQNQDVDEEELKRRLLARGINIDTASPEELLRVQPQIEAVIAEIKLEQSNSERAADAPTPEAEITSTAEVSGATAEENAAEQVQDALNRQLPPSDIYGHNLFRNKSLSVYRNADNVRPPDTYPLRAGDEISVTIFGASQTDFILVIDEEGFIILPNGSRVQIGGVPLGEARVLLRNRLQNFYAFRPGQISIRVQTARTISIDIFGEVETNGTFTLSSVNTAFNALVAAGGPTDIGTVRNIRLIRGGQVQELDVYAYLSEPDQNTSLFISDNDIIYVPLAETLVTLEGGVARPFRYELKADETLADLLDFAGGTTPRAETGNITLTRYTNGRLQVIDLDLATQAEFELQNGDIINVPVVTDPIEDFVSIEGNVDLPGRYAYTPGLMLRDVLERARIRPTARRDVAFLFRNNDDGTQRLIRLNLDEDAGAMNLEMQRGDRLSILTNASFVDQSTFTVGGAVRDTSVTLPYPQDGRLSLDEAILLAGGLRPNAAQDAVIERTPVDNRQEREYIRVQLSDAANITLEPFDRIQVYEQERFTDALTVTVGGAVRAPGDFRFDPNLAVRDLLYLAGGLEYAANPDRVDVYRLSVVEGQDRTTRTLVQTISIDEDLNAVDSGFNIQPFDEIIVRRAADFDFIEGVELVGEVRYPGRYALLNPNDRVTDIINRAGGLSPSAFGSGATLYRPSDDLGYVVLDVDHVMANPTAPDNMVLRSGDTIYIPRQQDVVSIYTDNTLATRYGVDSTSAEGVIHVAYQGPKDAGWYISNYAGGFNEETARKRWTTVEYATGQIKETKNFLGIRNFPELQPGASIRIPSAPPERQRQRREERFDWIGLTQIILGAATTITTLIVLNQRNRTP